MGPLDGLGQRQPDATSDFDLARAWEAQARGDSKHGLPYSLGMPACFLGHTPN